MGVEESQGVSGTRDTGKCIINLGVSEVRARWRGRSRQTVIYEEDVKQIGEREWVKGGNWKF